MKETTRNLLLGLFMMLALGLMGWLVVSFGESPINFGGRYLVQMHFAGSRGIGPGTSVFLNDQRIGQIMEVRLNREDRLQGVVMIASIDSDYDIPSYAEATIISPLFAGKSTVTIQITEEMYAAAEALVKKEGNKLKYLQPIVKTTDRKELPVLPGRLSSGLLDDLPTVTKNANIAAEKFVEMSNTFMQVSENLNKITQPISLSEYDRARKESKEDELEARLANLSTVLQRVDETLSYINLVIGKDRNRQNLEDTLENAKIASDDLRVAIERFERISSDGEVLVSETLAVLADARRELQLVSSDAQTFMADTRADVREVVGPMVETLSTVNATFIELNKAATDLSTGDGTAGRLLRDNRLYEGIIVTNEQVQQLITEFRALAKEWREKGIIQL